jgi:hypothetical protein
MEITKDKTTAKLLYELEYILERMQWLKSWDDDPEDQMMIDIGDMLDIVAILESRERGRRDRTTCSLVDITKG